MELPRRLRWPPAHRVRDHPEPVGPVPGLAPSLRGVRRTGLQPPEAQNRLGSGPLAFRRYCSLTAGELGPQRGQGLVAGQRATAGRGVPTGGVVAGVAAARSGLGVGLLRRGDLLAVRLEAGLGLGVLPLPLLALGVVALAPLLRLGVEALGVQVVALLVVRGGHAVGGRVELLVVTDDALVGLLERERDPAAVQVDVDDLDQDLVAHLHDLLRDLHVALGQLGDVDQALDALVDADERTEGHQLGDLAGHDLADLVRAGELTPRVLLRRLQRQGDTLAVEVDVEDLDGDLLAHLDDLGRVVDVLPGQLGDVHQTIDAAEVDERTEVDDRGDDAGADLALGQLVEELAANLGLRLLQPLPAGQDDVVAVLVELDDLGLELAAHVGLQVADAAHLDQRGGQEPAQADVEDEDTLDDLDDGAGDDLVGFLLGLDRAPGALVLGALLGQDQAAFLVLLLEDESFYLVADLDDLVGVDVVLDGELTRGDDALGLVADVQQHLVPVDLDDHTFDDVAVVEVLDGLVDRGEEVLGGADVVDRDLGGAGRTDLGGGHMVECSGRGMRRDRGARGRLTAGRAGRAGGRRPPDWGTTLTDLWRIPMVRTRGVLGPPGS